MQSLSVKLIDGDMRVTGHHYVIPPASDERVGDALLRAMVHRDAFSIELAIHELSVKMSADLREFLLDAEVIAIVVPKHAMQREIREQRNHERRAIITGMKHDLDIQTAEHAQRDPGVDEVVVGVGEEAKAHVEVWKCRSVEV